MEIDTMIRIHLTSGYVITDECNYKALLNILNDESEYLMSLENIVPKINIEFIETHKINESEEN